MKLTIQKIEQLLKEATPGNWTGEGNEPFSITLRKPAPSLSKHDSDRPTYWRCQDAMFVLVMKNVGTQFLLDEIKKLQETVVQLEVKIETLLDETVTTRYGE